MNERRCWVLCAVQPLGVAVPLCAAAAARRRQVRDSRESGAPADPLHIFPLTPHWRDSLSSVRAAARSLSFSGSSLLLPPIGALASVVEKVTRIISGQLPSPDRLFITGGSSLPSAGESTCFLERDASFVMSNGQSWPSYGRRWFFLILFIMGRKCMTSFLST